VIVLGVYTDLVEIVGNPRASLRRWRQTVPFLASLGTGAAIAMAAFAEILGWPLAHRHASLMFLFMGLLVGTIPSISRLHPDMRPSVGRLAGAGLGVALVVLFVQLEGLGWHADWLANPSSPAGLAYLTLSSLVAGGANVMPGMSGSYILVLAGSYGTIIETPSVLTCLTISGLIRLICVSDRVHYFARRR